MAGEAPESYELTRNPRPFANVLFGAGAMAAGTGSLVGASGVAVGVISIGLGVLMAANGMQIALRWPTRITVRDDGLVFRARTSERLVPWSDVESVRVSRGRYGGGIRWMLARRPHITTAATFENLHHLLVEVENRAPQALVSL